MNYHHIDTPGRSGREPTADQRLPNAARSCIAQRQEGRRRRCTRRRPQQRSSSRFRRAPFLLLVPPPPAPARDRRCSRRQELEKRQRRPRCRRAQHGRSTGCRPVHRPLHRRHQRCVWSLSPL